jgi:hypothetical protein
MKSVRVLVALAVSLGMTLSIWLMPSVGVYGEVERTQKNWNFDNVVVGQLPDGWKVEGTNQRGPLATWQVLDDESAPSGTRILALNKPNHDSGSTFNICWTDDISFLNGEIEVRFKAITGEEDQGGGIIWRAQNKSNYYIARYNPREDNFRIYYVRDGKRKTRASARVKLPAETWHTMKITHYGEKIEGFLNSKRLLQVSDQTFAEAGGIGLWTKADAVTSFDDMVVRLR